MMHLATNVEERQGLLNETGYSFNTGNGNKYHPQILTRKKEFMISSLRHSCWTKEEEEQRCICEQRWGDFYSVVRLDEPVLTRSSSSSSSSLSGVPSGGNALHIPPCTVQHFASWSATPKKKLQQKNTQSGQWGKTAAPTESTVSSHAGNRL